MFPVVLLNLLIMLIVMGLVLFVVSKLPLDATIKQIINVVVIVAVCIYLIYFLYGFMTPGSWYPHR